MENKIRLNAIRSFVHENKPAVIVGNGINRYKSAYAWDDLLKYLLTSDDSLKKDISVQNRLSLLFDKEGHVKDGVSYTEVYDIVNSFYKDVVFYGDDEPVAQKPLSLQTKVLEFYSNEKNASKEKFAYIGKFIDVMQHENIPVLTTNFDEHLELFLNKRKYEKIDSRLVNKKSKYHYAYPWNQYCFEEGLRKLKNPADGFTIWHIHGSVSDERSIQMGSNQYIGIAKHALFMMNRKKSNDGSKEDLTLYNNDENWYGSNTWLELVFHKNLLIFGLGLKKDEFSLRWLLMERMKYLKKRFDETNDVEFKKWMTNVYISCGKKLPIEQQIFLETCGFEVIELSSYKELYEDLWENWSDE